MGLLERKSLYDKQSRGTLGDAVAGPNGYTPGEGANAGPNPAAGDYYMDYPANTSSPYDTTGGMAGDQLKQLLENTVTSNNQPNTVYQPSPIAPGTFQDLHPGATDTFSGQPNNPTLGQFGGPYKNVGPADGFY